MRKMSVVVPCYNERNVIEPLLKRFDEVIEDRDIEIIIVDNGSSDGTSELLDGLLADRPNVKRVWVEKNQGYGFGILQGLKVADGLYVGWTHGDMQTDPVDVSRAYDLLPRDDNRVIIIGRRKKRPISEIPFTVGMSLFESVYLKCCLRDINAEPKFFHRKYYKQWKNPPFDVSLDLYAYYFAKRNRFRIIRFPVWYNRRLYGVSKLNFNLKSKIKMIAGVMKNSRIIKKKGI